MSDLTTIGGLLNALSRCNQDALVLIDNRQPTALSSYRGYYDHLAVERSGAKHDETALDEPGGPFYLGMAGYGTYAPGSSEVRIKSPATVGEMVKALTLAIGATFEGYKGGQYLMTSATDLWVSEYGGVDSLRISGIEVMGDRVDLVTKEDNSW